MAAKRQMRQRGMGQRGMGQRGMRQFGIAVLAGSLALAACGDDGESSQPVGTDADVATGEAPVPSGDSPAETSDVDDATSEAPGGDSPVVTDLPAAPSFGDGSCDVAVAGDQQIEWSGGGTLADVGASYWFNDIEREMVGDGFTLVLNCVGDDGNSLSFVSVLEADESSIPQGPGTYELAAGGGESDLFSVLVSLVDTGTNWEVTDPGGTLTITDFDDDSIAGTFELPMKDSLAAITGTADQAIVVTGTFDFDRPPASG